MPEYAGESHNCPSPLPTVLFVFVESDKVGAYMPNVNATQILHSDNTSFHIVG